jgi:tRNA dimethylallyltransferase
MRDRLNVVADRRGVEFLWRMVRRVDPPSAERILPRDRKRLIRALEVFFVTGRPLTEHFAETVSPLPPDVTVTAVALRLDGASLAARLAARVDAQFAAGLLDEVRGLLAAGVPATARPFGGLVYRQIMDFMRGERDLAATRELIVRENRRYARRQLIWFRKEPNLKWLDGPGESVDAQASVLGWLAERGFVIDRGLATHG